MSIPNLTLYSLKYLALPNVKIFSTREAYQTFAATHPILKTQTIRPPDVYNPPKLWIDMDAVEKPGQFVGQVRYKNVLAIGESPQIGSDFGYFMVRPVADEPNPIRRQFYLDFKSDESGLTVPYFDTWNMTVKAAASVNIPPSPFGQSDLELKAWAGSPALPFPCRPFDVDEAFCPSGFPSSELIVVNMNLWRQANPSSSGGGFTDADRAKLNDIWLKLQGPAVG